MNITNEKAVDLYSKILRIRMVEEEVANRYSQQQMRCPVHLSIGQESTPVGVCEALLPTDYMVGTHRAHAHYLAKGGDLKALISELYGKVTGCTRGQGGSMHLIDLKAGFMGATSIVAGTVPVGVGLALGAKMNGEKRISIIGIGDTVLEEGAFHEAANFASLKKLPVLFMCENNFYSCYSPLSNRQPNRPLTDVAIAHGMPHYQIDGNNVFEIYTSMLPIAERLRAGEGPVFIEFKTYRFIEHCGPNNDDNLKYRDENELAFWSANDPIPRAKQFLEAKKWWNADLEQQLRNKIKLEINDAFDFAMNAPYPSVEELGAYIYAK